jgi:3-oxoacyl-[acyl-carrier protein] reductase
MTDKLSEEVTAELLKQIPLARLGEPKDIAKITAFIASDDSAYMTGQTLNVNGGMVM